MEPDAPERLHDLAARTRAERAACGDFLSGGHDVYDSACDACAAANSDAPEP